MIWGGLHVYGGRGERHTGERTIQKGLWSSRDYGLVDLLLLQGRTESRGGV